MVKKVAEKIIKEGLGKVGDKMNDTMCPLIFYQPKACKRGEKLDSNQNISFDEKRNI